MRASAVVATAPWKVSFQEIEVPAPGNEDVVVDVHASWISNGTEGSFIRGERIGGDTPRQETDPLPFPHVPGYQKVGVVRQVGSRVKDHQPGDRVFATVSRVQGMFYDSGGHVSPAVTHRSQVWKLPAGIDPVPFSGLVLTQVGYNCGMRPSLAEGDTAVVIGDGLVGHWSAQTLAHRGARVMMIGRHDERLAHFSAPGSERVNERTTDILAAVKAWTSGGVQAVVDTVGSIPMLESLIPSMRRHGHIVSAGFYGPRGQLDLQKLRDREITLHAPAGWESGRIEATLDWIARGYLTTAPLITHRFPVERAPEAYDLVLSRRDPVLGVVLQWCDRR